MQPLPACSATCFAISAAGRSDAFFTDSFNRLPSWYRISGAEAKNHVARCRNSGCIFLLLVQALLGFLQLAIKKSGLCRTLQGTRAFFQRNQCLQARDILCCDHRRWW